MSLKRKAEFTKDNSGFKTYQYKPEYCDQLVEHMSEGYDFVSFGAVIGVCKATLYNWAKAEPDFADAHERGKAAFTYFWQRDMQENRLEGKKYIFRVPEMCLKNVAGWTNRITIEGNAERPLAIAHGDISKWPEHLLDKSIDGVLNEDADSGSAKES